MRTLQYDERRCRAWGREDRLLQAVTVLIHQSHTVGATNDSRSATPVGVQPGQWQLPFERRPGQTKAA